MISNLKELRAKDIVELAKDLESSHKELFKLRLQRKLGESPRPHNYKILRHNIARINTIITEKGNTKS